MPQDPRDPKASLLRLFGDTDEPPAGPRSILGEEVAPTGPRSRLRASITRLRILRSQAGSDGLTPAATRSLVDEVLAALEAISETLPPDADRRGAGGD